MTDAAAAEAPAAIAPERTGVIQWESLPRRLVTLWLPLSCFVIVLLFPFYWMAVTALKSNEELYNFKEFNPLWVHSPTLANINRLLFETDYPRWLMVTMTRGHRLDPALGLRLRARRLRHPAPALHAAATIWASRSTSPTSSRPRSCSSRWRSWSSTSASTTARWR